MCRSRRELSNEYFLAKIGVDTAENELLQVLFKIIQYYSIVSLDLRERAGVVCVAQREQLVLLLGLLPSRDLDDASESVGWQNFGKMLLVFGCIGTDFCKKKYTSASRKRVTHTGERRLRDKKT